MHTFPIPEGAAQLAQATTLAQAIAGAGTAVDDAVAQEAALQAGYFASTGDQLSSFLRGKVKPIIAKMRKTDNAIGAALQGAGAAAVEPIAATGNVIDRARYAAIGAPGETILTPQQYAADTSGSSSVTIGILPGFSVQPVNTSLDTLTGSLGNDTVPLLPPPPPPPPHCTGAAFPVHTMDPATGAGQWWMVCDHSKCIGAYGTLANSYDTSCFQVHGPYDSANTIGLIWIAWQPTYGFGQDPPPPYIPPPPYQPPPPFQPPPPYQPPPPPFLPPPPPYNPPPPPFLPPPNLPPPPPPPGGCTTLPAGGSSTLTITCAPSAGGSIKVAPFVGERPEDEGFNCAVGGGVMPNAGTEDWCAEIPNVVRYFRMVGQTALKFETGTTATWDDVIGADWGALAAAVNGAGRSFVAALNWVASTIGDLVSTVVNFWAREMLPQVTCDKCALLGVRLTRWFVSILSNVRVGISLIANITIIFQAPADSLMAMLTRVEQYICPALPPGVSQLTTAWMMGELSSPQYWCRMQAEGHGIGAWQPWALAQSRHVPPEQFIMWRRLMGDIDPKINDGLVKRGWKIGDEISALVGLYDRPPTPAECLAWASNAVTLPAFAADYSLDSEFEPRLWGPFRQPLQAQGITEGVAREQWRHAQQLPGEGRLLEALHRLRPGRVGADVVFRELDYQRHLASLAIPPYWRARASAMSDTLLGLGQAKLLVHRGVISEGEYYEVARDHGYNTSDSALLRQTVYRTLAAGEIAQGRFWGDFDAADAVQRYRLLGYSADDASIISGITDITNAHRRIREIGALDPRELSFMRGLGVINSTEFDTAWQALGFSTKDGDDSRTAWQLRTLAIGPESFARRAMLEPLQGIVEGLRGGFLSAQQAIAQLGAFGVPFVYAAPVVNAELYAAGVRRAKQAEIFLRRAYIRGKLTESDARQRMTQLGFQPDYVAAVVPLWTLDQTTGPKQATAGQVVRWFKDGIITQATAQSRLRSLGYLPADIALLLKDALHEKPPKKPAKKPPKPTSPPKPKRPSKGDVMKWFKDGLLNEAQTRAALADLGYEPTGIDFWIADACGPGAPFAGPPPGCAGQGPPPGG